MNNHIIRQKNGSLWHICYTDGDGIVYRRKRGNYWTGYKPLFAEGKENFSAAVDCNDIIHLICSDRQNNIMYLIYKNNAWHEYVLLSEADLKVSITSFKLVCVEDNIYLFYTAQYNGFLALTFYALSANARPETVDIIQDCPRPFSVAYSNGTLCVYYTNPNGEIGYKCYDLNGNPISGFNKISSGHSGYTYTDDFLSDHIIYVNETNLYYANKSRNGRFSERVLISESHDAQVPVLFPDLGKLWAVWLDCNMVYYCTSSDGGMTWSKPVKFIPSDNAAEVFIVQTPAAECDCYGSLNRNDIHLFVIGNVFNETVPNNLYKTERPKAEDVLPPSAKDGTGSKTGSSESGELEELFKSTQKTPVARVAQETESKPDLDFEKLKILIELQRRELLSVKTQVEQLTRKQESAFNDLNKLHDMIKSLENVNADSRELNQ